MSAKSTLVGRVARRRFVTEDSVSGIQRPFFLIEAADDDSCHVREFLTGSIDSQHRTIVGINELEFDLTCEFSERFPSATTVHEFKRLEVDENVIVDLRDNSHGDLQPQDKPETLTIRSSCRIIGQLLKGHASPTLIPYKILVETGSDDDVVEFENVTFINSSPADIGVTCMRGCITFRHCCFMTRSDGVAVGSAQHTSACVFLESCHFHRPKTCGIISSGGQVTLVNCVFSECEVPVSVRKGGHACVHHCQFNNALHGVIATDEGRAEVHYCHFDNIRAHPAVARNGAKLHMTNCSAESVDGILIEGGTTRTTAVLRNVRVISSKKANLSAGIKIGRGKMDVEMKNVRLRDLQYGVYVDMGAIGSVIMSEIGYTNCAFNFLNISGEKCWIAVQGELQHNTDQAARLAQLRCLLKCSGIEFPNPRSAYEFRLLQRAQMMNIVCGDCTRMEKPHERYRKCGACNLQFYCSRACQKAHWKKHADVCAIVSARELKLRSDGFVSCA